jgi:Fe-S cluster assembly protein SufD
MTTTTDHKELALRFLARYREQEPLLKGHSPAVLHAAREKAIRTFMQAGIPDRKNENYKYTTLTPFLAPDYQMGLTRGSLDFQLKEAFKCDIPRLDTILVVAVNGWFHSISLQGKSLPEGVLIGGLEEMALSHPELFNGRYGRLADDSDDALAALNTAFARDGFFIYVPRGVKITMPIQVINILESEKDTYVTQRNLVIAEPESELRLVVCDHTLNLNRYFVNTVTEVYTGANASVDLCAVQNQHNRTGSVHSVFHHLEREAHLTTHAITLHGGMVRNNLKVILDGEYAEANLYGMAFLDRQQHVDNFLQVIHACPNCQSNQHFKNVLDDTASGAFSGRIHVMRDAQKTNAYQRNNSLLLTDKALMQTKPQLIIEADDVKCSHGATVGQIDEEALFYLRARGIEASQARLMLMNAFSYEVVQQIRIEPLRDRISDLVDKRLRGDVGRCHECAYQCEC